MDQAPVPSSQSNFRIFGLIVLLVLMGGCALYANTTYKYYQQLQSGNGVDLSSFAGEYTDAGIGEVTTIDNAYVDRYDDDPQYGNPDAELVVVMFEDFQCPFCKRLQPGMKKAMEKYKDQVLFVYRDFPLASIHPDAQLAAEAGNCADAQGQFWEYHDLLFDNQDSMSRVNLSTYAAAIGLNRTQFDRCLDSGEYTDEVDNDAADGRAAGVYGTPTLFFNGNRVPGVLTEDGFSQVIDLLLTNQN